MSKRRLAILAALPLLALTVGGAYAAIPDAGGVYHACVLNNVGAMRIIDPSLPPSNRMSRCTQRETEIEFNQRGQQGLKGDKGDKGDPGKDGAPGAAGAAWDLQSYCALVADHPRSYEPGPCRAAFARLLDMTSDSLSSAGDDSITIGADGNPVVSYRVAQRLRVLFCGTRSCSAGSAASCVPPEPAYGAPTCTAGNGIVEIDRGASGSSIAIGTDGDPIVSYIGSGPHPGLNVATCGQPLGLASFENALEGVNFGCGPTIAQVDVAGGGFTSIAIGTDGNPVVSYYAGADGLKVAHCGNASCTSGNVLTTVDPTAPGFADASNTSIAIGSDGYPVIAYYDTANGDLKVAHCGNVACSAGNTVTVLDSPGDVGRFAALAVGFDGKPVVSYFDFTNSALKVAHCGDVACSAGNTLTAVDTGDENNPAGRNTSIAIGADGKPVVSYTYGTGGGGLKLARCGNAACSSGTTFVDLAHLAPGSFGGSSIAIGTDGRPVVSFTKALDPQLWIASPPVS